MSYQAEVAWPKAKKLFEKSMSDMHKFKGKADDLEKAGAPAPLRLPR